MKREVFNYPPSVEVLKLLTPGSLKQNLAKAVRLWVILRSIYGDDADEIQLELKEEFTFFNGATYFFLMQQSTIHATKLQFYIMQNVAAPQN